jgi:hypothetical protein
MTGSVPPDKTHSHAGMRENTIARAERSKCLRRLIIGRDYRRKLR